MAAPEDVLWPLPPHTKAKHDILERYLHAWIPILGMNHDDVIYIDGFAGPGEYSEGEDGSPILALKAARRQIEYINRAFFVFIEEDERRQKHLATKIEGMALPDSFTVHTLHGQFGEIVGGQLDRLQERGQLIAPAFVFADPFGFKDMTMPLLHRILGHGRTEVFTNFAIDSVNRFKDHPEEKVQQHIRSLLGGTLPDEQLGEDSYDRLRRGYTEGLSQAADFVRRFEMYDYDDQPKYDLFFASNHPLGHTKMKEAMWAVDPEGDFRFSDATDPRQETLFSQEAGPQLIEKIMDRYESRRGVVVGDIEDWIEAETPFLSTHMKAALNEGETAGRFYVEPEKVDGSKRRKSTFPAGAVIDFTRRSNPDLEQGSLF